VQYLTQKNYQLHLITNGFEDVQWGKLRNSGLDNYFKQVITSERAQSLAPGLACPHCVPSKWALG
jgi:putative hydrolase of the HAD superfamily